MTAVPPVVAAPTPAPPSTAKSRFLVLLIVIATLLVAWILFPIAGAVFLGVVFAVVLHPAHERVSRFLGGRRALASGAVTLLAVIVVGGPMATVAAFALREFADQAVTAARDYDEQGLDGLVDKLPRFLRPAARRTAEWLAWSQPQEAKDAPAAADGDGARGEAADPSEAKAATANDAAAPGRARTAEPALDPPEGPVAEAIQPDRQAMDKLATDAASSAAAVAGWLTQKVLALLLDCAIAVLALFCLLAWGPPLVQWVREMIPMPLAQSERLVSELRDTTRGVVYATFVTAIVQTFVASAGYLVAGVGSIPLAAAVTFVAAMIPVVGAAIVTCLVGVLQILADDLSWGLFLIGWGVIVVNLTENILTPWLCGGRMQMNAALLLFAMIGGISVFGPLGLVAGPLIVAFFRAVVEIGRGAQRPVTTVAAMGV